ncbi:hypothetical protein JB92DRAFT_632604 [Gautieria morchelliformis]|nr:hypothetical protein JB92DRAFT_632604 [Gautieria morchelliformis]
MSFNEFQWRLLNLCGEFYEAATELVRSTPHLVLSQAFQLLNRGTGLDPISVLNDARRTCDMLLANPQALATAPPLPTTIPLPIFNSLAHLNSRASVSTAPTAAVPPPSYYPQAQQDQDASTQGDKGSQKGKEKERLSSNVQGTWKDHEVQKLRMLAEKYRARDKSAVAQEEEEEEEDIDDGEGSMQPSTKTKELGDIDWDKVVAEFGDERSRHQVLIKATYLGLKSSSTLPGKKPKKKKQPITSTEPPPPTFSSASVKSIPAGYPNSQLATTHSPSASPEGHTASPTSAVVPPPPQAVPQSSTASPSTDSRRQPAPLPLAPQHQHTPAHAHAPAQYPQTGWYPHPQSPYYAYHQPMYYSAHPPNYGIQNYLHTPQPGYYGQSYGPPLGMEQQVEKPALVKGRRKETRKKHRPDSESTASSTPIPPPSLPPRAAPADASSARPPTTVRGPLSTNTHGSAGSTPVISPVVPPASTGAAPTSSSGVLRRGPNNSLFTYTPLPHGGASADQNK